MIWFLCYEPQAYNLLVVFFVIILKTFIGKVNHKNSHSVYDNWMVYAFDYIVPITSIVTLQDKNASELDN
jgi:hypothetical protein